MFYQYNENLTEISIDQITPEYLTAGYVTSEELCAIFERFGFAESTVIACQKTNKHFRSGVEIYDSYTFTELRVVGDTPENDDWIVLYIMKNLLLVVDVLDKDESTKQKFVRALTRYSAANVTLEKLIFAYIDALIANDIQTIEDYSDRITNLEDELLRSCVDREFNSEILDIKKKLTRLHYYYEQILDITQSIEENENEIFESGKLMYISNLTRRVERLREDADSQKNSVEHLQDAYYAYMDTRMNQTMKLLTVITTIFFPLTIIVGWYGMNFVAMPELTWKFGYLYVILLSAVVVVVLAVIGKIRKWF